ncbi:MAG: PLP-dependent aminotransferase family protein [Verrucomicrobiae bacterium]|nr:PLP-dependent aminotransferase family protein [Verrucomicrobiae bacterium]
MGKVILGVGVIQLDRRKKTPLHRQLYEGIRRAILESKLERGSALPATRSLAKQLNISRMTVVNAYDQLLAEGYLTAHAGSGTFVNCNLPDDVKMARFSFGSAEEGAAMAPISAGDSVQPKLSARGRRVAATDEGMRPTYKDQPALFSLGIPALDEFPLDVWTKICRDRGRAISIFGLTYQQASGWMPLRQAICEFTKLFRGIKCHPEQVFVTAGIQQAIDLTSRLLLDTGDTVLFEDPGYWRAREALKANGAALLPLPVDANGASIRSCGPPAESAKLIYITPSHQFPLGVTMSIERRIELLDWARRHDTAVIEDDYDSVYSYSQPPIPSLQGLDSSQRTFYMGSLSKLLFPALGMGYLIVPSSLVGAFESAFKIVGRSPSLFMQQVVHDFIAHGHLERHMRRMRKIHEQRHSALIEAIDRFLPDKLQLVGAPAGLHRTARILIDQPDTVLIEKIANIGFKVQALSIDSLTNSPDHNGLVFGFGCGTPKDISAGIRRIAAVF